MSKREQSERHPCDDGCQYSKDVGMWSEHSCGNGCMYERRCQTGIVGAAGECLACDAEQGVACRAEGR